jgi:tyrosyl-tRNA synthetase
MFGKLMSVPDGCMSNYFTLLTLISVDEIRRLTDAKQTHPMEAKKRLAVEVTAGFCGSEAAGQARSEWEAIHQKKASTGELVVPADAPTVELSRGDFQDGRLPAIKLIVAVGFAASNGEARRLIGEGGIRLNGQPVKDALGTLEVSDGDVLQRGKRKFVRLAVK